MATLSGMRWSPEPNWLAYVGRLRQAKRETLEDVLERILRIYDAHVTERDMWDPEQLVNDFEDVLDDLRRDL